MDEAKQGHEPDSPVPVTGIEIIRRKFGEYTEETVQEELERKRYHIPEDEDRIAEELVILGHSKLPMGSIAEYLNKLQARVAELFGEIPEMDTTDPHGPYKYDYWIGNLADQIAKFKLLSGGQLPLDEATLDKVRVKMKDVINGGLHGRIIGQSTHFATGLAISTDIAYRIIFGSTTLKPEEVGKATAQAKDSIEHNMREINYAPSDKGRRTPGLVSSVYRYLLLTSDVVVEPNTVTLVPLAAGG